MVVMSCLDPYDPPVSDTHIDYLVVDAFLNSGNKSVQVTLSKGVPLDAPRDTSTLLSGAAISVEGEDGLIIQVPQTGEGFYYASSINIENGKRYQLRIKTEGKEYLSDLVELKKSPTLDSVTWRPTEDGVTVYVDSHDETGSTKYYQWVYTETWQYHSDLQSFFLWNPVTATAVPRTQAQDVFTCYNSQNSTRVLITTTKQNTLDIVADFPLATIPLGSRKLQVLYSILVQQRALDEAAFNYWKNLQKTTENLGSLFDPLPSQVNGNIHNVRNSNEPVLGYFAGGEVQEKRLFIGVRDLPKDHQFVVPLECNLDSIPFEQTKNWKGSNKYVISTYGIPFPLGYTFSTGICADCRESGGVVEKPSFWPN